MVHVVEDERATVEEDRPVGLLAEEAVRELVGGDGPGSLEHQLPLQRVVLGAGARRQADGLQLAALGRG